MNRREFVIAAGAIPAAASLPLLSHAAGGPDPLLTKAPAPGFGAYDPYGDFSADKSANIEHLFLPWEDVDLSTLPMADTYALERGRDLLITIEPWTWSVNWRVTPSELKSRILSGHYDFNMETIAAIIGNMKSRTTIRFAHEMEDKSGQFTWAAWNPADYIAAYKRMTGIARRVSPGSRLMWSPKGDEGLEAYYPGDENVDMIGLSVFGLQKWDRDKFGGDRSFKDILALGYDRVQAFGKPVVVAELGYSGDQDYVSRWDAESRQHYGEFSALTAVSYFNQKEVYPWPDGYGLPDWRVRRNIIA